MKAFEIIFNPRASNVQAKLASLGQNHRLCDCFSFFNKAGLFSNLGHLFLLGQVDNALAAQQHCLSELAQFIAQLYYNKPIKSNESALLIILPSISQFLADFPHLKWHLALAALAEKRHLRLTVLGEKTSAVLLQRGQAYNLVQEQNKLSFKFNQTGPAVSDGEPRFTAFSHIIEGKINKNDKLVLLTEQALSHFLKLNIFPLLQDLPNPKRARDFFKHNQSCFYSLQGACLIIFA